MSNSNNTTPGEIIIDLSPVAGCRVAYTLNNCQPVRSSFIGDQPLFYMDHADGMEDDAMLMDELGLEYLEDELNDIKSKIDSYDRIARDYAYDDETRAEIFDQDKALICGRAESTGQENDAKDTKQALLDLLGTSRMGQTLLEFAAGYDVEILLSDQVADALYNRDENRIIIRQTLETQSQILLLARELRRVWQHRQGARVHPLTFHPDQAILVNRAQEADLCVTMIRVAWELQLNGEREVWARIENSTLDDVGRAFAREACIDFRSIAQGSALSSAFEAWFLSERCRKLDRTLIQQMLADYNGYIFNENADTSRSVTLELIAALGSQPFGKNYLAPYVELILNDPVFTDVRDRSNANFLWFIKFEKSFRETERELQQGSGHRSEDGSSSHAQSRNAKDRIHSHDQQEQADILVLPTTARREPEAGPHDKDKEGRLIHRKAEIVDLQPWLHEGQI